MHQEAFQKSLDKAKEGLKERKKLKLERKKVKQLTIDKQANDN